MKLRNRLLGALGALGLIGLGVIGAWSQAGMQILTTLVGTEIVEFSTGTVSNGATLNTIWNYGRGTNLLYTTTATAASTATTAENTIGSYTLAANTLNTGTKLIIRAAFDATANTNNKTAKCYFGASVISSGAVPINDKNIVCQLVVTKTGSNTQTVWGTMQADSTTMITPYINYGTDTDTSSIIIKVTSQSSSGAAAGELTLADFSVERLGR